MASCTGAVEAKPIEATQGQNDGFFSQLPYKCHQHLWEIDLRFAPGLPPGWEGLQEEGDRRELHGRRGGEAHRGQRREHLRVWGLGLRVEGL